MAKTTGGMTMRVYVVNRAGQIKADTGTRRVDSDGRVDPDYSTAYPRCQCPHCRRPKQVAR